MLLLSCIKTNNKTHWRYLVIQYQTHFDFIHDSIVENHGSVAYYLKLFSRLNFNVVARYQSNQGRCGYDCHTMIKIALIGIIERLETYPAHRRFLMDRPRLCEVIGLPLKGGRFCLPSDATFSKYFNSPWFANAIKTLFENTVRVLLPVLLHHYDYLCVDSQPVFANSALNNPKNFSAKKVSRDKDASWGVKGKSNAPHASEKDFIYYFGHKIHMLSLGPIPLTYIVTHAKANDSPFLKQLLQNVMDSLGLCSLNVCADKGYDSHANFDFIHERFKGRAFIPKRRSSSVKLPTGACDSFLEHHSTYLETRRQVLKSKYNCPLFNPSTNMSLCPFKDELGVSSYGCTRYRTLSNGRYRDWIDASSPQFKKVYRHRLNVENLFSIAEDGRLKRINGFSSRYLETKVALFCLFIVTSASLALSQGKPDWLMATVKLKDSIAA